MEGGSANDYDYVGGDPVNQLDLTGECLFGKRKDGGCKGGVRAASNTFNATKRGAGAAQRFVRDSNYDVNGNLVIIAGGISKDRRGWHLHAGWGLGIPGLSATVGRGNSASIDSRGTACYYACASYGVGTNRQGQHTNRGWSFGIGTPQAGWFIQGYLGGE